MAVLATRVDAIFDIQAGQVTTKNAVRENLCNIIRSAKPDR